MNPQGALVHFSEKSLTNDTSMWINFPPDDSRLLSHRAHHQPSRLGLPSFHATATQQMLPMSMIYSRWLEIGALSPQWVPQRSPVVPSIAHSVLTQLLYSTYSSACIINAEYADPAHFDQVFDIFSTQSLTTARSVVDDPPASTY